MREILFRGKREDNGEWVEGFLIGRYDPMQKEHIIKNAFIDNGTCFYDPDKVIPETVGQFTGLTDKNGKRIFEGDCIGCKHNVVEYYDGTFTINGDRPLSWLKNTSNFVVVGNIHDNPELLNKGGEG